jgi:hypothetical protein
MKMTIRKEMARLWYVLKIAAGTAAPADATGEVSETDASANEDSRVRHPRNPALVVISRAGRTNVQAQHRRSLQADGRRPAYALPYSPHTNAHLDTRSAVASVARHGAVATVVDGDAGMIV